MCPVEITRSGEALRFLPAHLAPKNAINLNPSLMTNSLNLKTFWAAVVLVCATLTAQAQDGCTDATACNFDNTATTDDGSCCYSNCLVVDVVAGSFFDLYNAGWELRGADGTAFASGGSGSTLVCTINTCFDFVLTGESSSGWWFGSEYTLTWNGVEIASAIDPGFGLGPLPASVETGGPDCTSVFGCTLPYACNYDETANFYDGSCTFSGCTDPAFCNYDPAAGCDDGSCTNDTQCGGISCVDATGALLDFTGDLAPENWTTTTEGVGYAQHTRSALNLVGSNGINSGATTFLTQTTTTAPRTGDYSFSWDYYTLDGPLYDIAYYINGVRFDLTSTTGTITQAGTITFTANAGDQIGFGIDATDNIAGPGYLLISDFTAPAGNCGCVAPTACNYDPDATGGTFDDCDWSCYGCTDAMACNYDPTATILFDFSSDFPIENDINTYFGFDFSEANAAYDGLGLEYCIQPNSDFDGDCTCTLIYADTFFGSDAYFPTGSTETTLTPSVCGDYAYAGHGTGSATLNVDYPCGVANGFYNGSTGSNIININVPQSMTNFDVFQGTGSVIYNITYNPAFTTVTFDNGTGSPTFNLITTTDEVCSPSCHAPTACNYDPSGILTDESVCDWSCYGCTDVSSCTYDPTATLNYSVFTGWDIADDLEDFYGFTFSESNAFVDALGLQPCIAPNPDFNNECECSIFYEETFFDSDAYFGTGSGEVTLTPEVCGEYAYAGHATGSATLNITYPCGVANGFYNGSTGSNTINITVPETMINFDAYQGTGSEIVYNITYNPAFTTVTTDNGTGNVTFNLITTTDILCFPGCMDPVACNYDAAANYDDGSCSLPDGCDDPAALNFCPSTTCSAGCLYLNDCGDLVNEIENLSAGFAGPFAPGNWNTGTEGGDGSVTFTENQLFIVGNNDGQDNINTFATLVVPVDGLYKFNWQYTTSDAAFYDPAFFLNGDWTEITDGDVFTQFETGSILVSLTAGDEVGFRVTSTDGCCGNGNLVVSNFIHPGTPDCNPGCTIAAACNYDPAADHEDGSCSFAECLGCTYADATNYDMDASIDDGSCMFELGSDCPEDLNNNGQVDTPDLLNLLGAFGSACP